MHERSNAEFHERPAPRRRILLRISPHDESVARRSAGFSGVAFCRTDDEALANLAVGGVLAIVWELSKRMPRRIELVPRRVVDAARERPLLIHIQPTAATIAEIVTLSAELPDLRTSLFRPGDLETAIRALTADPPEPSAEQTIIRRVAPNVDEFAQMIVVVGVIAGKRRTLTSELVDFCGCPTETIRYRLSAVTGMTPSDLLGEATSLHTAWRCGVLEWPIKRAADEARMTPQALDQYLQSHVSLRLRDMRRPTVFRNLLERFANRLKRKASGEMGP